MRRARSAFTLLELLTAIAIMGVLITILIPSLTAARRSAKARACLSHLKLMGNGFVLYLNENTDRFPPFRLVKKSQSLVGVAATAGEDFHHNDVRRRAPRWQWFLETDSGPVINPVPFQFQIGQAGFFDDLSVARAGRTGAADGMTMSIDVFTCPSLDDPVFSHSIRDGAYGYNYQYLGNTRRGKVPGRWANYAVGLHRVRSPTATVVAADSRGAGHPHGRHSFTLDPPRLGVEVQADDFGPVVRDDDYRPPDDGYAAAGLGVDYDYSPVEPRHNKRGNVLFADSHAEAMTLKELGYQFKHDHPADRLAKTTPHPVADSTTGTYSATNKLWNGQGVDKIAAEHRSQDDDEDDGGA